MAGRFTQQTTLGGASIRDVAGNIAEVVVAGATLDEALEQYLAEAAALYAYDGTDLARLTALARTTVNGLHVVSVANPSLQADEATGDNTKILTVTAGEEWRLLLVHVEIITTGTVGNRTASLQMRDDADDEIHRNLAGANQAQRTTRHYEWAPGFPAETAFVSNALKMPLPDVWLPAGYDVRITDNLTIDVTDTVNVQMLVDARTV